MDSKASKAGPTLNQSGASAIFTRIQLLDKAIDTQRNIFDNAVLNMQSALGHIERMECERSDLSGQLDALAPTGFMEPELATDGGAQQPPPPQAPAAAPRAASGWPTAPKSRVRVWHRDSVLPKRTYGNTANPFADAEEIR